MKKLYIKPILIENKEPFIYTGMYHIKIIFQKVQLPLISDHTTASEEI